MNEQSIVAVLVGMGMLLVLIALVWWVLQIIAYWRLFTKAGVAGWKSIIPIYSNYTLYKIVWQPKFFWISLVLPIIGSIINTAAAGSDSASVLGVLVSLVCSVALLVLQVFFCIKTSKAYGYGGGFAVGLFFLQPIFMLILGLGSSEYQGNDL